jgi:hypothetical protein
MLCLWVQKRVASTFNLTEISKWPFQAPLKKIPIVVNESLWLGR